MPKLTKIGRTRKEKESLFGGVPSPLPVDEPCTYRGLIQCFYHLRDLDNSERIKLNDIATQISAELHSVWLKVNSSLPILSQYSIFKKVMIVLDTVVDINHNRASVVKEANLNKKLDTLFDISLCKCSLSAQKCSSKWVHCNLSNCSLTHYVCVCPIDKRVPPEEVLYLRDQRSKVGLRGKYQMSSHVDSNSAPVPRDGRQDVIESSDDPTSSSDNEDNVRLYFVFGFIKSS